MSIIEVEDLNAISLPFPSFQPNTIILSEQVNDNNEEMQFKTNLLITSYNKHLDQALLLEQALVTHIGNYDTFVTATDADFVDVRQVAENNRITLDGLISKNASDIIKKADNLELKNYLLSLKSGDTILSVVDLTNLEGTGNTNPLIEDEQITPLRTWSSEKIKNFIDDNTPKLPDGTPIEDAIISLQQELNGQIARGINIVNNMLNNL